MLKKSKNDLKKKYHDVLVDTLVSMHITDILTKAVFLWQGNSVLEYEKTHNIKFCKELEVIMIVDKWLYLIFK